MFPELPTDNLYKFMALGGLTLAGFFFWIFWKRADALRDRAEAHLQDEKELTAEAEAIRAQIELGRLLPEPERSAQLPVLTALLAKVQLRAAGLDARYKSLESATAEIHRIGWSAIGFAVIGIIIANIGFGLWYTRVQRYQDIILHATADSVAIAHRPSVLPTRCDP